MHNKRMRITLEHYNMLQRAIINALRASRISKTTLSEVKATLQDNPGIKSWRVALAWQLFDKANRINNSELTNILYKYMNDSHIKTALLSMLDNCLAQGVTVEGRPSRF